jgi:hypothetical protein
MSFTLAVGTCFGCANIFSGATQQVVCRLLLISDADRDVYGAP